MSNNADYEVEEIKHLTNLIFAHRERLRVLELQEAKLSSVYCPPHIITEQNEARRAIESLEAKLREAKKNLVENNNFSEEQVQEIAKHIREEVMKRYTERRRQLINNPQLRVSISGLVFAGTILIGHKLIRREPEGNILVYYLAFSAALITEVYLNSRLYDFDQLFEGLW